MRTNGASGVFLAGKKEERRDLVSGGGGGERQGGRQEGACRLFFGVGRGVTMCTKARSVGGLGQVEGGVWANKRGGWGWMLEGSEARGRGTGQSGVRQARQFWGEGEWGTWKAKVK